MRQGLTRLALAVTLVAVSIGGCARTRPFTPAEAELPSAFPDHTLEQIQAQVRISGSDLQSMRARAALTLASPERSGRFSAEIREAGGDSLYMSISPGLGIEAIRVLVTPDSVFVYDRLDNRVRYGSSEEAAAVMPVPLSGEELARSLAGRVAPSTDVDWKIESDSAHYHLIHPAGTERYVIDPAFWRVIRYERRTANDQLIEERIFESYSDVEGHILPQRLVFRLPREEATVVLTYRDVDPNPGDLSFDLRVSDSAEWTPVSE